MPPEISCIHSIAQCLHVTQGVYDAGCFSFYNCLFVFAGTAEMAAVAGQALLSFQDRGMAQHPIMHFPSPIDISGRGGASGALTCVRWREIKLFKVGLTRT